MFEWKNIDVYKLSIKTFVYDLIGVFMFPNEETKQIYKKYKINRCYLYQNLTDTDRCTIISVLYFYL